MHQVLKCKFVVRTRQKNTFLMNKIVHIIKSFKKTVDLQ